MTSPWWKSSMLMLALKWGIFLVTGWYLYREVIRQEKFTQIATDSFYLVQSGRRIGYLLISLLLIFVNWGLETGKWQYLIRKFQKLDFFRSFLAILAGTTVSLWLPNRSGEYIGRLFFIRPEARLNSVLATFIGGISQLVVTLIMGTLSLLLLMHGQSEWVSWLLPLPAALFIFLLLFFYFNIHRIRHLLPKKGWTRSLHKYSLIYRQYKPAELNAVLMYSLARYLVFSTQFYLMLKFFGADIPLYTGFLTIFLAYLAQTAIPTNFFTELGVRGASSVFFFSTFAADGAVLSATYALWIINLLLPGIAGLLVIVTVHVKQKVKSARQ